MLNESPKTSAIAAAAYRPSISLPPPTSSPPSSSAPSSAAPELGKLPTIPPSEHGANSMKQTPQQPSSPLRRKWSDGPKADDPIAVEATTLSVPTAAANSHPKAAAPMEAVARTAWMDGAINADPPRSPRRRWGDSTPKGTPADGLLAFFPAVHERPETPDEVGEADVDSETATAAHTTATVVEAAFNAAKDAASARSRDATDLEMEDCNDFGAVVDELPKRSRQPAATPAATSASVERISPSAPTPTPTPTTNGSSLSAARNACADVEAAAPTLPVPSPPVAARPAVAGGAIEAAYGPYTAPLTPRSSRRARWYLEKGWATSSPAKSAPTGSLLKTSAGNEIGVEARVGEGAAAAASAGSVAAVNTKVSSKEGYASNVSTVALLFPASAAAGKDTKEAIATTPDASEEAFFPNKASKHECSVCFKRFAMPESLKAHEWVHDAAVVPKSSRNSKGKRKAAPAPIPAKVLADDYLSAEPAEPAEPAVPAVPTPAPVAAGVAGEAATKAAPKGEPVREVHAAAAPVSQASKSEARTLSTPPSIRAKGTAATDRLSPPSTPPTPTTPPGSARGNSSIPLANLPIIELPLPTPDAAAAAAAAAAARSTSVAAAATKEDNTPPTPPTPTTPPKQLARSGIAPLIMLPVIATLEAATEGSGADVEVVGTTTATHIVSASPFSTRKNWCTSDAHRFQTIGFLAQSPIRQTSPELAAAASPRRPATSSGVPAPSPRSARKHRTLPRPGTCAGNVSSTSVKSWSSSTQVDQKVAPISLAFGEKLMGSPRSARKPASTANAPAVQNNKWSSPRLKVKLMCKTNAGASSSLTTNKKPATPRGNLLKAKSKSCQGGTPSLAKRSSAGRRSSSISSSSSSSSPSQSRRALAAGRGGRRASLNETWPAKKPASPARFKESDAEKKASAMRGDFKAWLQWRKQDSKRADEAEAESQKISEDSHPDDFAFDVDGNPIFKSKQTASESDQSVEWLQPVDNEDYKARYRMARKKKLVSEIAP